MVRQCLSDPEITAGQLVEVFRETIKMEAEFHREIAKKSQEAIEQLNTNPLYKTPEYLTFPENTRFMKCDDEGKLDFKMGEDGLYGSLRDDVLSL